MMRKAAAVEVIAVNLNVKDNLLCSLWAFYYNNEARFMKEA
jgi:hypothetical protein